MWLYLPETIYHFSRESQASTSDYELLSQRLAVSAMSRSELKPPKFWLQGLKKDRWTLLRSGLTCEPSQASSIVAGWLDSLPDSRARITPSQVSELELSGNTGNSGMISRVPFATWVKTSNGSAWRTFQVSLFPTETTKEDGYYRPDYGLFLETFPASGSMRNGLLYERPKLGLRTVETDGSVWPTARAEDAESCGNHPNATDSLTGSTKTWLTTHGMNGTDHTGKQGRGGEFAKQATNWLTPKIPSGGGQLKRTIPGGGLRKLEDQVENGAWGTPTSRDWKDGTSADTVPENGLLGRQAGNWPTPRAEERCQHNSADSGVSLSLACLSSLPDREQPPSGSESSVSTQNSLQPSQRKRLNGLFTLWLMGLPPHWLAPVPINYGSAETQSYLCNARRHLESLLAAWGIE